MKIWRVENAVGIQAERSRFYLLRFQWENQIKGLRVITLFIKVEM